MRIKLNNGGVGSKDIDPAGGTVTLPLKLMRNPVTAMEAATSAYVESVASSFDGASVTGVFSPERLPAYTGAEVSSAGNGIFTLSNTGVAEGTYAKVTVNNKGRVTAGGVLLPADIPNLSWNKVVDRPTTLSGYSISDVVSLNGGVMTGALSLNATPSADTHLVSKGYVDTRVSGSGGSAFVTGDVVSKSSTVTPAGFLRCNGGDVSKTTYAALFAVIGEGYVVTSSPNSGGKPWVNQYDFNTLQTSTSITGWSLGSSLPGNGNTGQAVVTKNRVYLVGITISGVGSSGTTYTAPINPDGTLGTWATGPELPVHVNTAQAVVIGNRLYLFGGSSLSTVHVSVISPDGTLGAWSVNPPLPGPLWYSHVTVTSSRVYLLGGFTSNAYSSIVYTAPINIDGTLGAWSTGTALPATIGRGQVLTTDTRVYLIGGWVNGAASTAVYTAPINTDGTLGTWATWSSLPATITDAQLVASKNRAYVMGGLVNGAASSSVYSINILVDGTIGSWTNAGGLSATIYNSHAVVTNGQVHLMGGVISGAFSSATYKASFLGGENDYTGYTTLNTTPVTDFRLPDLTLEDAPGFFSYIKF